MKKRPLLPALALLAVLHAPSFAQSGSMPPPHLPPWYPPVPTTPAGDEGRRETVRGNEDLAFNLSMFGTAIPVTAGGVAWAVRGHATVTSVVLVGFGAIVGPSLGYDYVGLHRTASAQQSLRGSVALCTLLLALDQGDAVASDRVLVAGAALDTGLALYDVSILPECIRKMTSGANLEFKPRRIGMSIGPSLALAGSF